jgi:UV DNA damage endonuclease
MVTPSLCCIHLGLQKQGYSFQTMTWARFSKLDKDEALSILGSRIQNNIVVTNKIIQECHKSEWDYRCSSSLFPLITMQEANISLESLPNYTEINTELDNLKYTIKNSNVRISSHPDQFNVLASENQDAVKKTIKELNFQSWFFDRIGLSPDHNSPINLHIQNKTGKLSEVISRFLSGFSKLDDNCQKRLVCENDDKLAQWSVKELIEEFYPTTKIPITFDYLHHKCHPNQLSEEEAFYLCYDTWDVTPLFHYSESDCSSNPRKHAEYAKQKINNYGLDFTCDFELKMKDKAIQKYMGTYHFCEDYQKPTMAVN